VRSAGPALEPITLEGSFVRLEPMTLDSHLENAIKRIGAKEEGILRKHTLMWTGLYRDTVLYGILDDEWPQVKAHLETLLILRPAK
jgi:hypothetical protein